MKKPSITRASKGNTTHLAGEVESGGLRVEGEQPKAPTGEPHSESADHSGPVMIARGALRPWAAQPRKVFKKGKMTELADSLRSVGQLQPLIVRLLPDGDAGLAEGVTHEIIVGERRWRASEPAGLSVLEVRVLALTDKQAAELAVMENTHRDDLTVIEEAHGYKLMVSHGWSVAEIADRGGKTQAVIRELLDLCELDEKTQAELMDGTITRTTARVLGRIEDMRDRAEAIERVVMPRTQDQPLPERRAVKLIQEEYLEPQKRAKEWGKRLKAMEKEFAGATVVSLRESGRYLEPGSGYVRAADEPEAWELAVHMRDQRVPTWAELAEKHGAAKVVVADSAGQPVVLVAVDPIKAGELAAGERDAERCIFPIAGGEGRHQQSLVAEKKVLQKKVEEDRSMAEREALQVGLLKHLRGWWADAGEGEVEAACGWLLSFLVKEEFLEGLDDGLVLMGIDVESIEGGAAEWVRQQIEAHEMRALPQVLSVWSVGIMMAGNERFPEQVSELAEAVGYEPAEPCPECKGEGHAGSTELGQLGAVCGVCLGTGVKVA